MRLSRRSEAVVLGILGDPHCNCTVGLCPPGPIALFDGGTYTPSREQGWLWECYRDFCQRVKRQAREVRASWSGMVVNGDAADKNVHSGLQLIEWEDDHTIVNIAVQALTPAREAVDRLFVVHGTASHSGLAAHLEAQVARELDAVPDERRGRPAWRHIKARLAGVRASIAHHPGTYSGVPWTKGNVAAKIAAKLVFEYGERPGLEPPQLVVRSHNHKRSDSGTSFRNIRALVTPAFCLFTEYDARYGRYEPELADIGGYILTFHEGACAVDVVPYEAPEEPLWCPR